MNPPESLQVNAALVHYDMNRAGRDFAVGDIHGAFSALQRALDGIGFSPATDRLFSVGDLVDRGPESGQVLDWLDKPWFHAICGNHDFMTWRSALGHPCLDVDHRANGGLWLDQVRGDERQRIGERLAALPVAMEVQTPKGLVGLVHADCPHDDWDAMRQPLSHDALDCCLWSRERLLCGDADPIKHVRAVVHGHTTLPVMQVLGNVYFIDTGGWRPGQGHFTLLDLHSLTALLGPRAGGLASWRH
ncbi:MAG: metallophosphoesterase [Polaromonas sp.]|nr:metallophosphoesterase [Polaromonas sp.]